MIKFILKLLIKYHIKCFIKKEKKHTNTFRYKSYKSLDLKP